MYLKIQLFITLVLSTIGVFSQVELKYAQFSILTVGPGDEMYSIFGHTALRLQDTTCNTDLIFNWGTFDFDTPNFYGKFAGGNLDYMLSIGNFNSFIAEMSATNRFVKEQILDLNENEKQQLYKLLVENYRPENRYYRYDFLFDNCATRVRDIVVQSLDQEPNYNDIKSLGSFTYRQGLGYYMEDKPFIKLGIDILLGLPADRIADVYKAMFLPNFVYDGFSKIKKDSVHSLVVSEGLILSDNRKPVKVGMIGIALIFIVFGIVYLLVVPNFKSIVKTTDLIVFTLSGFVGFVVFYMWFLSDHVATGNNLNILWAFPLNTFLLFFSRKSKLVKGYMIITGTLCFLYIGSQFFLPQFSNLLIGILALIIGIRAFSIAFQTDKNLNKYFKRKLND